MKKVFNFSLKTGDFRDKWRTIRAHNNKKRPKPFFMFFIFYLKMSFLFGFD